MDINLNNIYKNLDRDWKQYIVINKGINMSKGKMAAQVSHASLAYFTRMIRRNVIARDDETVKVMMEFPADMFDGWIEGVFTKVCLEAKNESQMQKTVDRLIDAGFAEGKDFFKIIDAGTTEFNGQPTWTCIGCRPLDANDERVKSVFKKLQLFKE